MAVITSEATDASAVDSNCTTMLNKGLFFCKGRDFCEIKGCFPVTRCVCSGHCSIRKSTGILSSCCLYACRQNNQGCSLIDFLSLRELEGGGSQVTGARAEMGGERRRP